jgi:hypothetical protein
MTFGSIKTFVSLSLLALATTSHALPLVPYGPDGPRDQVYPGPGGWAISVNCKHDSAPDDCVVSATKNGRIAKTIIKASVLPSVQWYSDIAMMRFPCGSGCQNDMFFSPPNKVDGHALVAEDAIDTKRRLVVSVESNPLKVYRLFAGSTPVATLRLATSYTQPEIERLQFEQKRLVVWYRDDNGALRKVATSIPER